MVVQFLARFTIPILLVLIFFFLLFIVVFLLHRRSKKKLEEDPIITSLENNNVDSFLRAIHEIDQPESGPEGLSPKQTEGDEDTLVQYVSDSDSEDEDEDRDED